MKEQEFDLEEALHKFLNDSRKVAGCASMVFVFVTGTVLSAFVLTMLWSWFIVPFGVVTIGMAHAMGLTLVTRSLVGPKSSYDLKELKLKMERVLKVVEGDNYVVKKDNFPLFLKTLGTAYGMQLFILLFGYLIHFWV